MIQILIAILAGVLTIAAPCILPVLPIVLGGSVGQKSKTRPFFIALGFIVSFTLLALVFGSLVHVLGLSQNTLRSIAITLLGLFGLLMIWPLPFELLTIRLNKIINKAQSAGSTAGTGNAGGFVLGLVLGIIWTPCAGPVLGSILTLIATQAAITTSAILLFAYAVGASLPMLAIAYGGQIITTRVRFIARYSGRIQQIFGVVILLLALAMYFQYDVIIQARLVEHFPTLNPKY